ncbi:MAG: CDP-alcohol phosphatidyltransferase family protein [Candidatus Aminicenantes bacterium]|nr:MAG: CDP-alcohol phosphatidyltransferase family protein [Candidatus Aminicenantes bacterium]
MKKQKEDRFWTVPNFFSMLRIFLIPFFLYMMLQNKILQALIIFLIASATDILDGMTARIWNQKTKIGGLLDPAADKLLMMAAIIILSIPSVSQPNTIPLWLVVAIIGRDIAIVSAAFVMYKWRRHTKFPPSLIGKTSTVCQMGVILCVLLLNVLDRIPAYLSWLYFITFALTILSGFGYGLRGIRALKDSYR